MISSALVILCATAAAWQHPAGAITPQTLQEVRAKLDAHPWARGVYEERKQLRAPWLDTPSEKLRQVFPTTCANVYHNFSCPHDRTRLQFDPFNPQSFHCPTCGSDFAPETDPGVYPSQHDYHGTIYDGWACLFYQTAAAAALDLAIIANIDDSPAHAGRAIEIIQRFADTIRQLPVDRPGPGGKARILTYHREGDNKILYDLAQACELLRGRMTPEQRATCQQDILQRMLDGIMLEPCYPYDHNNVYQWHRTIIQTALALERQDLIDWAFGFGAASPQNLPEHRSLQRIITEHFKPDGAYWELCSGYHLYPLHHLCEIAILSHNLAQADPQRFPPAQYDFTDPASQGGKTIKNALEWFTAMAMPDRTMPAIGDSTNPRAGLDDYAATAETGYRYFDLKAVGDYPKLTQGKRSWFGLLYGAPEITQHDLPFTSSCLSSGWVSLRNEWGGDRIWAGLNALQPGGGHQHADRLSMTYYAHGQLLALEKATPYNESTTRTLGTLSPMHNTVTIDKTSQPQGETLTQLQTPEITGFLAAPFIKCAEIRADRLHPNTHIYRRTAAIIEDILIDTFQVQGGQTHDWTIHHAGGPPALSLGAQPATFDPQDWLANGTDLIRHAQTGRQWSAAWHVQDITSRLTMLPAPHTHVYSLQTYPIDNAIITPGHPPCQTLCVRRTSDAPFIALWDAWKQAPNLQTVRPATQGDGIFLQTEANTYYCAPLPGRPHFHDGVKLDTDAAFALLRNRDAMAFINGTYLTVDCPQGTLKISLSQPGGMWAHWPEGPVTADKLQPIEYDTIGGQNHRRQTALIEITFQGSLMKIRR